MASDHSGPAFIPAPILHDPELSPQAKLLAGRIINLQNKEGFCWASNKWLADDLCTSKRTLERWMTEVLDSPYFMAEYEKTKDGTARRIWPINPLRESGAWGYADLSPALRKSVDQAVEGVEGNQSGHTPARGNGPSRRQGGKPAGPGDPTRPTAHDVKCPDCGTEWRNDLHDECPYCERQRKKETAA